MAQKIEGKEERPLQSFWLKDFLAVDTSDSRISPPNNSVLYDLLNAQPIGFSNIHSIDDISTLLWDFAGHTVYADFNVNIQGVEYLICACQDGTLWAYCVDTTNMLPEVLGPPIAGQAYNIGSGMSADMSVDVAQYDYTTALIIDSSGYWSWKGAFEDSPAGIRVGSIAPVIQTFGAPTHGNGIAVYSNMVWISQERLLYYSSTASTNTDAWADFTTTSGGGYSALIDPTLRSGVTKLFTANGFLYIFGESSIDAISDVYIPQGATSPTPSFTRLNVSAVIGTDQPESIMVYGRLVLFANRFGIYMLYGTSVQSISSRDANNQYLSSIDGTWQYLPFDRYIAGQQWINNVPQPVGWMNSTGSQEFWLMGSGSVLQTFLMRVSGGQVMTNRLLNAAFLVARRNDPVFGAGTLFLMDQEDMAGRKWWSSVFQAGGEVTHCCTAFVNNAPALFGYINNKLYQFFANPASAPPARIMTALNDFGDPLSQKQAIRVGMRISVAGTPYLENVTLWLDTLRNTFPIEFGALGAIEFRDNTGNTHEWANNAFPTTHALVFWSNPAPYLNYWGKAPECFSPYLGFRVTTLGGTIFELNSFQLDYKTGARWIGT